MKRETFVTLLLTVVGTMLFGIGMCMCLLPEWNVFREGVIFGAVGLVVLLATAIVRRKMLRKAPFRPSLKSVAAVFLAVVGALTLGTGMCMCMVWEGLMLWGIPVGMLGIILLLCLIPLCKGIV